MRQASMAVMWRITKKAAGLYFIKLILKFSRNWLRSPDIWYGWEARLGALLWQYSQHILVTWIFICSKLTSVTKEGKSVRPMLPRRNNTVLWWGKDCFVRLVLSTSSEKNGLFNCNIWKCSFLFQHTNMDLLFWPCLNLLSCILFQKDTIL